MPSAHPRSRGEHFFKRPGGIFHAGSSPLARGTLHERRRVRKLHRLIPARAGNTISMSKTPGGGLAHPRSRGEHLDSLVACLHQVGSSPLARGTPRTKSAVHSKVRLIPARAGNMHASTKPAASCPAHPRSRGEHITAICILLMAPGSPPLARGTRGRGR